MELKVQNIIFQGKNTKGFIPIKDNSSRWAYLIAGLYFDEFEMYFELNY